LALALPFRIAHFQNRGYTIIGISNQGGVAMGYKSLKDAIAFLKEENLI
jgi:histidinol phosphatase-like enzyme